MKKTLRLSAISVGVLAASVLLSSTAFAAANYKGDVGYKGEAPCPAPEKLMSGFYIGGQIGYDMWRVRENVGSQFDTTAGDTANPAVTPTGFIGGLFLGYGQYFSDYYYLGGEVLGNYSGASTSYSIDQYSNKFNAYGTWGLAVLPGLKLNNTTLLYVRLGYNWTNVKAQESTTAPTPNLSASKSFTSGGFTYGLGMESLITQAWSLRGEVSHTNNSSFSTSISSYNPSDTTAMVGLVYHFG